MCREVVGIDKHQAAVYLAVTRHHAIAGDLFLLHAEVGATVVDELVQLVERAFVQQQLDALAGGHLAYGVLLLYLVHAAAQGGALVQLFELLVYFFSVHDYSSSSLITSSSINVWLALTASPSATKMLRTMQSALTL